MQLQNLVMKVFIISIFFLGHITFSFGQTSTDDNKLRDLTKLDIGVQGIGFTWEPRLSNKATMDISIGAGGGYDIAEGHIGYKWDFFKPAFYFSATPKFYYNRKKRIETGKNSKYNSGNYIGLRLKYITANSAPNDHERNSLLINLHWGLQRAIGNRWTLNAHVGGGYAHDLDYKFGTIYPSLDFKFSYILSKPKM